MSVLIKGLVMPSCCDGCTFSDWSNLHQTASCKLHNYDPCFADHSREYVDKRADLCPLVEIPVHGRLIDADALKETLDYYIIDPLQRLQVVDEAERQHTRQMRTARNVSGGWMVLRKCGKED